MQIIVNGLLAVLKKNTSFEFATENSLFTGSDSYTLAITFPLKDCRQNQAIFGMINRKDAEKENIILDCTIRDKGFFKAGVITITEVGDTEVKAQFLEGRSIQNFEETFDDIYVNELRLGYPSSRNPQNVTPAQAWAAYPTRDEVALPWVNNTSGNMQNEAVFENNAWSWEGNQSLTFQPYLIPLLKKICTVLEYTYDFSELEASEMKYLLICNSLPAAWGAFDYAYALPHWSLTEWFEELENFLFGEFLIDHKKKHIVFHFSKTEIQSKTPVVINKVINAYTVSISLDKECEYIGQKNIRYAENDNRYWAYRDCEWYIKEHKDEAIVYSTLSALLAYAETLKESGVYAGGSRTGNLYTRGYQQGSDGHKLFYAEDVDTYFIMFCYDAELVKTSTFNTVEFHWYKYYNRLEPVNQFGEIEHSKEAPELELKIVPAWIDDTDDDHGQCLFLECGEMGSLYELEEDDQGNTSSNVRPGFGGNRSNADVSATVIDETDYDAGALAQGQAGKMIAKGEQDKSEEHFSCLYVGYWDGTNRNTGKSPFPFVHTLVTKNDFTSVSYPYSLSLRRATQFYDRSAIIPIDGKKKYVFSWLSDEIPDVKSEFYIWGKRFLCEKISTTFTEDGRSKLLKGEFYKTVIGVYIISGIVSDGTNPISGVVVTIGGVSVTTGANGSYSLTVKAGSKEVSAVKSGYVFESITINVNSDMTHNIAMTKVNTVSGVVTDGTNPLSGVVVTLGNKSMTTGANGTYSFSNVTNGTYTLSANKSGYTMNSISLNVTSDIVQNISMAEILYTVSGVVTDGTNPLSGVVVSFGNNSVTTGADGAYSFANVRYGTYTLTATKGGYTMNGMTINVNTNIVQNISMEEVLYTVSGVVTDGTNPLSGVVVSLGNNSVTTGADGAYSFANVRFGSYTLGATKSGYSFNSMTVNVSTNITQNITMISYETEYLTFEAIEGGTFTLNIPAASLGMTNVSYSVNGGAWVDNAITANSEATITTPSVNAGDKVRWKGSATKYGSSTTVYSKFSSSGKFNVYGNILSLTHGDNIPSNTTYNQTYLFANLFRGSKIVDASNMILPSKTGANYCYYQMFYGCSQMVNPPQVKLTSTSGNYNCNAMFYGCSALVKAPDLLPASVGSNCYRGMFSGCTSLKYIKMLGTSFSTNALYQWCKSVPSGGTFVKASAASITSGENGIPNGWTVENV